MIDQKQYSLIDNKADSMKKQEKTFINIMLYFSEDKTQHIDHSGGRIHSIISKTHTICIMLSSTLQLTWSCQLIRLPAVITLLNHHTNNIQQVS